MVGQLRQGACGGAGTQARGIVAALAISDEAPLLGPFLNYWPHLATSLLPPYNPC
jgi:hypothetical protein